MASSCSACRELEEVLADEARESLDECGRKCEAT